MKKHIVARRARSAARYASQIRFYFTQSQVSTPETVFLKNTRATSKTFWPNTNKRQARSSLRNTTHSPILTRRIPAARRH